MSQEIINDIGNLFITIMAYGGSIASIFYVATWVCNFLLSLIFPSRYGM